MPPPGPFPPALPPALPLGVAAPLAELDWESLGLVLLMVASFLLANSILSRHPREMVAAHFGRPAELRPIREYIFHKVQWNLGFLFLLVGFGLQLVGRLTPDPAGPPAFPALGVGLALVAAALLLAAGWWWSHRLFRRYLREYLLLHPPDFENEPALAREIGELFGVSTSGVDTVQSYAVRLREHVGLPGPSRSLPDRRLDDEGAEEETGVDLLHEAELR